MRQQPLLPPRSAGKSAPPVCGDDAMTGEENREWIAPERARGGPTISRRTADGTRETAVGPHAAAGNSPRGQDNRAGKRSQTGKIKILRRKKRLASPLGVPLQTRDRAHDHRIGRQTGGTPDATAGQEIDPDDLSADRPDADNAHRRRAEDVLVLRSSRADKLPAHRITSPGGELKYRRACRRERRSSIFP